jgi:intergrase/recombinase
MNMPYVKLNLNHVNPKWIMVGWAELDTTNWAQTGGDNINYYELEWDKGTNGQSWTVVTNPSMGILTVFNVTSDVTLSSGSIQ